MARILSLLQLLSDCVFAGLKFMSAPSTDKLTIAISSRALFNLDESHEVYEQEGLEAYQRYQIEHEDEPLETRRGIPVGA